LSRRATRALSIRHTFAIRNRTRTKEIPMSVIVEIRAAEGGDDAKLLVGEQFSIYAKRAARSGL
jgi:protein subunit release factor A